MHLVMRSSVTVEVEKNILGEFKEKAALSTMAWWLHIHFCVRRAWRGSRWKLDLSKCHISIGKMFLLLLYVSLETFEMLRLTTIPLSVSVSWALLDSTCK